MSQEIQRGLARALAGTAILLLLVSCGPEAESPLASHSAGSESEASPSLAAISLGDVEAHEPLLRIRRIQPLADFLGERLAESGIGRGQVIVARDLAEMTDLLRHGRVDLYLDSPLASLIVQRGAGTRVILRRWARDDPEYWTVFITQRRSEVRELHDLRGRVIAFQERDSTSGFLLPAAALVEAGLELRTVSRLAGHVASDEVGCFFSGDEENALELVVSGMAEAGVISNQDLRDLPEELADGIRVFARTEAVPRQLVSVRSDLDPHLVERVRELLLGLTEADREWLAGRVSGGGWTWRFDELPQESWAALEELSAAISALALD